MQTQRIADIQSKPNRKIYQELPTGAILRRFIRESAEDGAHQLAWWLSAWGHSRLRPVLLVADVDTISLQVLT